MNAEVTNYIPSWQVYKNDYHYWYNQGLALANSERYEDALTIIDQALEIQSSLAALVLKSAVLIQLERYEEALTNCVHVLTIQPEDPQAWFCHGAALNYLGRYKESYISYARSLGLKRQSRFQKLTKQRALIPEAPPLRTLTQNLKKCFRRNHSLAKSNLLLETIPNNPVLL